MRVLVTGGAGFIGSALVDRLLVEDHHVEVVDDLSTGTLANLSGAREHARTHGGGQLKIHQADVTESPTTDVVVRAAPDAVVHLAGPTAKVGRDPADGARRSIVGAVRVLEGAARAGCGVVVCLAGARAQADPIRGIPDRAVHEYLDAYREVHGIRATTLVAPTVYGPRQTPATESSVVATFVARVLAGEACVVHGDGTQRRDLLHVDDAVDALVRAIGAGLHDTLEIGTGTTTSIAELQVAVARAADADVAVVGGTGRDGEPGEVGVDPRRAATVLGWSSWTDLGSGLAHTVAVTRDGV